MAAQTFVLQTLVARLINIIGLDEIKKTVLLESQPMESLAGDPRTKGFQDGKLETVNLEALFSLEDNFGKLSRKELDAACQVKLFHIKEINFEVLLIIVFQCVAHLCNSFLIPPDHWLAVGAAFLKLYLVILFNCMNVNSFSANFDVEVCLPQVQLGRVLFLASSLVNHSCDSNMYSIYYGTSVVFRAKRPIGEGEQLTTCYSMPATKVGYRERKSQILNGYKFKCR